MELNNLYNADCMDGMKQLPDESVDLVVTDCPYHIVPGGCSNGAYGDDATQKYHECSGMLSKRYKEDLQDDAIADTRAGKLFKYNDIEFASWLPEVYRVLKNGTHCYIMINARNLCELQTEAEKVGFQFQNLLVWKKNNATPNRYYLNQLEFILMLRKGPARNINDMGQTNFLSTPNIIGKKVHPTEKPVSLMKVLIVNSSNKGDLVLDPFAGSGSTLLAAMLSERKYIGFEIDPKYYKVATDRLYHQPKQTELF